MVSSRIFRSRWAALLWSAEILWTAWDVASDAPEPAPATNPASATTVVQPAGEDATEVAVNADDLAALANAMG